ncbi:MAG: hypothetical protein HY894_03565 [Deltaproteobacteria bacterium]|nr:hypothetical protein [Deltaproteobacteria bacterium]
MKTLWRYFSSIKLTIALAAAICIVAVWGSLLAVRYQEFYRYLDQVVLVPWLAAKGTDYPKLAAWIYVLILLTGLFAINTAVCTADKVLSIVRNRLPARALFPHIVHAGFLIAMLGHLAGSVSGYKSSGNVLWKGVPTPVPHEEGLSMRLDGAETQTGTDGELTSVRTRITLLGKDAAVTGDIGINSPMIYRGIAFYHADAGSAPTGLALNAGGNKTQVGFGGSFKTPDGKTYNLGEVYPDFAMDPSGHPTTLSQEFRNPYVEIIGGNGKAFLFAGRPGSTVTLNGNSIRLDDYALSHYVMLNINKDPGIWLIIAGSAVLTAGMLLLLFLRGERAELLRRAGTNGQ